MKLSLTFLVLLILQISSIDSHPFRASSCGFESCNLDRAFDDAINEVLPSDDYMFLMDSSPCKSTGVPSTPAPTKTKDMALEIAINAADAAQAANEAQASAAAAASRQVHIQLADKAADAARTAHTVYEASKESFDKLARETRKEESLMEQLTAGLKASEANAKIAEAGRKRLEKQTIAMKAQLEQTKTSLGKLDDLIEQGKDDLENKNRILALIKERIELLSNQVEKAKNEYNQAEIDAKKFSLKKCPKIRTFPK
ncbi:uncharacterized protein LOC110184359 [Drosophila serrata]|uniref:uncharacterized protein LOC110184359 n=1 Tax=Drosophila serrata TaxID=7274 RepID=UPI000A1D32EF|nr:uncharacterized protein LOC110184359 [Drosophila serrata]